MQQVTIQSNNTIIIGKDTKLTAQEMISKEVKSFKWSFDNIALIEKESNKSSLPLNHYCQVAILFNIRQS